MKKVLFALAVSALFPACSKDDDGKVTTGTDYDVNVITTPVSASSSKWISEIVEYRPAPGQWINELSTGTPEGARGLVGSGTKTVSLGGFGGYIVFRFDHSVLNNDGYDFVVKGNAYDGSSEPGVVMVSVDVNGNGIADDQWYELRGENHSLAGTRTGYTITYYKPDNTESAEDVRWTDNMGGEGVMDSYYMKNYHNHCFYPLFLDGDPSQISFTGTLLAPLMVNTGTDEAPHWYLAAAGKGYADNFSAEYTESVMGDSDTARSNKFDIATAVDNNGRPVKLRSVDFIKVYTAVHEQGGNVGEASTEICGAISLTAL